MSKKGAELIVDVKLKKTQIETTYREDVSTNHVAFHVQVRRFYHIFTVKGLLLIRERAKVLGKNGTRNLELIHDPML